MKDSSGLEYFIDFPRTDAALPAPHPVERPLTVAGWILPPRGHSLEAVELSLNGRIIAFAAVGGERPDVHKAFPDRPEARGSGFSVTVRPADLPTEVNGGHELVVVARWDGGQAVLSRIPLRSGADSDLEKVSDFWAEQFEARRSDGSYWVNNQIIERELYRLMTGGPHHWLGWLLSHYFGGVERFDRVLSLCCGDGAHEVELLRSGKVRHLTAFDISEGAVRQARERIHAAGFGEDQFTLEVRDANHLVLNDQYDLVLSVGAVHHVENLEGLMAEVSRAIDPRGHFVLVEFVGPNRFQWTDDQIELINGILGTLDPKYLLHGRRVTFGRPSIQDMIRIDPSEAIRSSEILGLVRRRFSVVYERAFNGTLMHQLYPLLNADLAGGDHPDFDSIIRLLLFLEDALTKRAALAPDFVFLVCQPCLGRA
jgi:SAM-dependent methyltransferase